MERDSKRVRKGDRVGSRIFERTENKASAGKRKGTTSSELRITLSDPIRKERHKVFTGHVKEKL